MACAALAAAGLAAGLLAGHARAASRVTVDVVGFTYRPAVLTVAVGTTVTWVNHDEETHTVTARAGEFASAGLAHDDTFTQTFTRAGTYTYACALHPQMTATVHVR